MLRKMVKMNTSERIKVRITVGNATVEIEALPDQVEEVVGRVVAALGRQQSGASVVQERRRGVTTCRDVLERLIDEGWFSVPRSLSDVVAEIARRGYSYDSTAIAHGLLDLVREERLVRDGAPRRYTYRARQAGGPVMGSGVEEKEGGSLGAEVV